MTAADEFNLGSLPDDALYHIASFLDGEDLLSLALIARSISSIASDCHLWRALLRRTYGQRTPNDSETNGDEHQEADGWKRLYFARKREWAKVQHSPLSVRVEVCARWSAVPLLREVLTRAGTDVNKIDGSTNVLHVACRGGSREVVAMLVEEFNADPNKKSQAPIVSAATRSRLPTHMNWHTPLSFAVGSGSEETVQWLLEHRARAELGDCVGCLIAASAKGVPSLVRLFLEKLRPFRPRSGWTAELLGNGDAASAKLLDDVFLTAIELASVRNLTSLQLLLADAPAGLAKKATAALDMAVRAGNAPAVGELLKHGVPPTKGPGEWAPIHDAAVGGNLELIRLLVQYGADAGIAVHYGGDRQNAHMIALQTHGKPDVVEFLRTAPSPMQREAQLVFRIVIACLSLALLVAAWFTI